MGVILKVGTEWNRLWCGKEKSDAVVEEGCGLQIMKGCGCESLGDGGGM